MTAPATLPGTSDRTTEHRGTTRRAVAEPLAGVHLERFERPAPGAGQVLVRSSLIGICGSDTHALAGHHPFLTGPYVPGHEAVGVITALGADVTEFEVGQRVLLKPNVACGACVNCIAGRTNACEQLTWIGCDPSRQWSGAMADYFIAPATNLFAVPEMVDDQTAALVECLATPVHAVRIAGDLRGARVVVLGAGTIGVLAVVAARRAGASVVVVTDMDRGKLARAVRVGADSAVPASSAEVDSLVREALGAPADVVIDCVASERSLVQAVGLLRRAGTLLVVGVPPRSASLPMPVIQDWEIRVQGCAAYTEVDVVAALAIASDGGIPTDEMVSGIYSLDHVTEAFAAAAADSSGKVLVAPDATRATGGTSK
jgi:2-desacetyl-2-hydroxyethyl bacteriochlorophyllide A dehydrogenase